MPEQLTGSPPQHGWHQWESLCQPSAWCTDADVPYGTFAKALVQRKRNVLAQETPRIVPKLSVLCVICLAIWSRFPSAHTFWKECWKCRKKNHLSPKNKHSLPSFRVKSIIQRPAVITSHPSHRSILANALASETATDLIHWTSCMAQTGKASINTMWRNIET